MITPRVGKLFTATKTEALVEVSAEAQGRFDSEAPGLDIPPRLQHSPRQGKRWSTDGGPAERMRLKKRRGGT